MKEYIKCPFTRQECDEVCAMHDKYGQDNMCIIASCLKRIANSLMDISECLHDGGHVGDVITTVDQFFSRQLVKTEEDDDSD